ncbi:MAG: hypothetical protein ACHQ53_06955 [Polyangiales bacterium]
MFAPGNEYRCRRRDVACAATLLALAYMAGCGSAGRNANGGGTGAPVAPPADDATLAGAGPNGAPSAGDPLAGALATTGTAGTSLGAGGTAGSMDMAGTTDMHDHAAASTDHCIDGYPPDSSDALVTGKPDEWKASNGDIDLVLPQPVLQWMDDRVWKQSHDAWHNVRRCNSFFPGFGGSNICTDHPDLVAQHQECSDAEDGYEFLVMHRHMMQGLKQAFPQHTSLFEGFPSFPFDATDVPEQWQGRFGTGWSAQIQQTAHTLEAIESNLSQFPTEGDLGQFIQCGGMGSMAMASSSIHGAMHFKWVVAESPNSLGTQAVNIGNYMFWKLHGWIDGIWERYRAAKGLTDAEPKLEQALMDQCHEMHMLGLVFDASLPLGNPPAALPTEHGFFHENVRPILDSKCSGCHSGSTPMAGLALTGNLTSAMVVTELVNVASKDGGQFQRVVPGNPDQSWLYLKVTNTAQNAGCTGTCNTQGMPPTGKVELSSAQLDAIHQWIADGAPAPTSP